MQKKLIALAVAGLASSAAFAQSNVTVYGVADVYMGQFDSGKESAFKVHSGGLSGSRLGFKGEEDLGNGLKAIFTLEMGYDISDGLANDTGRVVNNATADNSVDTLRQFRRQAFVGLKGNFGQLTAGRQYTPQFYVQAASSVSGLADWDPNAIVAAPNHRLNNFVLYTSPTFSGFTGAIGFAPSERMQSVNNAAAASTVVENVGKNNGKIWGALATYANGPVWVGLGYHNINMDTSTAGAKRTQTTLGGTYDFGMAKLLANWNKDKTTNGGAEFKNWQLGVHVPVGKGTVKAGYFKRDTENSTNDNKTFELGYEHGLSKRTTLYAYHLRATNDAGATFYQSIGGGSGNGQTTGSFASTAVAGDDPRLTVFGMRHTF